MLESGEEVPVVEGEGQEEVPMKEVWWRLLVVWKIDSAAHAWKEE